MNHEMMASLYVGDLHPEVTEALLARTFSPAGRIHSIRLCRDWKTSSSLGYAFVNFQQRTEAERAMEMFHFELLMGRPMRVQWSQRDKSLRNSSIGNLFIKNLDKSIDTLALFDTFSAFGKVLSCKVVGYKNGSKGYGYVHFESAEAADLAMNRLNGKLLNERKVFIEHFKSREERKAQEGCWGRKPVYVGEAQQKDECQAYPAHQNRQRMAQNLAVSYTPSQKVEPCPDLLWTAQTIQSQRQQNTKCIIHHWLPDIQPRLLQGTKTPLEEPCSSMSETLKYVDDEHKTIFLKILNEQRLEGEHCDIAVVVEDVKFRAHRCVLAACSNYFKKLFKKHEVDSSSVIEIDFIRSDIFEEVLNYMYTAKISVKKKDVNLMMSSGQILGIRFLDKLCSQKRDMSSEEKNDLKTAKYPYDLVKIGLQPDEHQLNQDNDVQVIGDQDDTPSDDIVEEPQGNHDLDKSPNSALRVEEATSLLKELTQEEVHKVACYDQDVEALDAEPKELAAHTQTLAFADSMGDVKDEQAPGWSTATADMKLEYLLYGHRDQFACQVCGKTFVDENRLRKHEKLHSAERPFICEICTKAFTTQAHLKEHLKIHTGFKPYRCEDCGKSFIRAPDLKKHERVHSNERPFNCHMCEKAFKHKSHLKDHERRHRGEKPFRCSSCTKAFAKASDLKRHENNMHSERKQLSVNSLQSETEQLQAAAMAAEAEQQLESIACS
ncbi:hypothetical protein AMELA_G00076490 [Ameiurus melas]|uniref:Zinc finger and BTB domain-containing protein 14 n=1 Tax=Ameiurus melas TaxID=219545 RepID=A0A7J6AYY7_AMEME|nr:hypothetical protein AMELA_G00076490 [Ameiurus melas]